MLHLVPFLVFAAAAVLVLASRPGWDLAVPVFLMPWTALTPDIGAQMPLSKLLFVLVLLKYVASHRFWPDRLPNVDVIVLMLLLGVAAAAVTLTTDAGVEVFEGGEFRNGWFRVLVVAVNFALTMLPLAALVACRTPVSVTALLRTYLASVVILCLIGWGQYLAYEATGTDYLPIGMFQGDPADLRSGLLMGSSGEFDLRPSAFAGEPKDLAMFAATCVLIVLAAGRRIAESWILRGGLLVLLVGTILVTQSSSALLALPVGAAVLVLLTHLKRPISGSALFAIYTACAIAVLAVFLQKVGAEEVPIDEWGIVVEPADTFAEKLYQRTIGRISVEDFDWVILKALLDEPMSLVVGRGFGLGHLSATPYIPDAWYHYMNGRVVFPKSGVTYALVNGGVASVILYALFFSRLTPVVAGAAVRVVEAQKLMMPLFILLLLRNSVFEVAVLVGALCLVSVRQGAAAPYGLRRDAVVDFGRHLPSPPPPVRTLPARQDHHP